MLLYSNGKALSISSIKVVILTNKVNEMMIQSFSRYYKVNEC